MKKLFIFVFAFITLSTFASNSSLFEMNEELLNAEFTELSILEEAVVSNPAMTVEQAKEQNLASKSLMTAAAIPIDEGGFSFDFGSFVMGLCCCTAPVGLFTIAISSKKSESEKKSYWIGVGAMVVINLISYGSGVSSSVYTY